MKRIVLGLIMAGGLAMMAAPNANAVVSSCGLLAGKSYAITLNGSEYFDGTEPSNGPTPNPVAGLGAIQVVENVSTGAPCTITGELLYNDNDTITGPGSCSPGGEALAWSGSGAPTPVPISGTVKCFTGTTGQLTGNVVSNSAGEGSMSITDSETGLTFNFSTVTGVGAANFGGTSVGTGVPESGTPPVPAILAIIGNKQTTTGADSITNTTFGSAPWKGQTYGAGFGVTTADSTSNAGIGGTTVSETLTNADGTGLGTANLNDNNSTVFYGAAALPGNDCHYKIGRDVAGSGPFADGTVNVTAVIQQPYTGGCDYANAAGGFAVSAVLYGTTNTYENTMFTGDSSALGTPGEYAAPDGASAGTSTPATVGLVGPAAAQIVTASLANHPYPLHYTNTSPEDCLVNLTLVDAAGSNFAAVCSISQAPSAVNDQPTIGSPVAVSPGGPGYPPSGEPLYTYLSGSTVADTPAYDVYPGYLYTDSGAIVLECTSKPSVTGNHITVTSPNCTAAAVNQNITVNN
jgi:hypothetical protein